MVLTCLDASQQWDIHPPQKKEQRTPWIFLLVAPTPLLFVAFQAPTRPVEKSLEEIESEGDQDADGRRVFESVAATVESTQMDSLWIAKMKGFLKQRCC